MVDALVKEIELRKPELQGQQITTIYFGGGTPSLLSANEINRLINSVAQYTNTFTVKEITLEANPDDLSASYLKELKHTPINRLSIGVQSFFNKDLLWMNRSHNANQALNCIQQAQDVGFTNLTIDLIFGSPTTSHDMWEENLEQWYNLNIPHLSAYALTVEQRTALEIMINKGKTAAPNDETTRQQFDYLMDFCWNNGVDQYEISNYCKDGFIAQHNTNYWFNKPYIGIGPSAHSYNGQNLRKWNIANNVQYIEAINNNDLPYESEELSEFEQMNEFILTRLRTKWGIPKEEFIQRFGLENWESLQQILFHEMGQNHIITNEEQTIFSLTRDGKHLADAITANLLFT